MGLKAKTSRHGQDGQAGLDPVVPFHRILIKICLMSGGARGLGASAILQVRLPDTHGIVFQWVDHSDTQVIFPATHLVHDFVDEGGAITFFA